MPFQLNTIPAGCVDTPVVVVKAPPPPKPVVPAVAYDNTPKTAPWWSADGVTANESKPAWWSTPQVVAAGADVDAKVDAPGKAAWCDPKRPAVAQACEKQS
jgi:hypothetical protein